jgi:hypothetical protein
VAFVLTETSNNKWNEEVASMFCGLEDMQRRRDEEDDDKNDCRRE